MKKTIHIFTPLKTKADRYQPSEYYFIIRNIKFDQSQKNPVIQIARAQRYFLIVFRLQNLKSAQNF